MDVLTVQPTPGGAAKAARPVGEAALRAPTAEDGPAVHALVAACPPLDQNSVYCNLLQCTHFAETCVVAERDGKLVGWVSGYRPPEQPDTLFVWQVAVAPEGRGQRLGGRMMREILDRPACRGVRRLTTTITPGNAASWAMFRSLAKGLDAALNEGPWLLADQHFPPGHDTEHLVTIGPFPAAPPRL